MTWEVDNASKQKLTQLFNIAHSVDTLCAMFQLIMYELSHWDKCYVMHV